MTTFTEEADLKAQSIFDAQESLGENVTSEVTESNPDEVRFTTSPQGDPFTLTVSGDVYVLGNESPANAAITFTATTVLSDGAPLEYYWDFGDGTEGWGNPVNHTYVTPNQFLRPVLVVTDQAGKRHYVSKQLYLV